MDSLMENRIEEKVDAINLTLNEMNGKIDKLQIIEIRNGGGRHITFRRDEFFQMLYDRPKEAFSNVAGFSDKALKILKFVAYIGVILFTIHGLI